jgi:hypothetical protein
MSMVVVACAGLTIALSLMLAMRKKPTEMDLNARRFRQASDNAVKPTHPWE